MQNPVEIVAVHVANGWAITSEDVWLPISQLYDDEGFETDDPDSAITACCRYGDKWLTVDLTKFVGVDTVH